MKTLITLAFCLALFSGCAATNTKCNTVCKDKCEQICRTEKACKKSCEKKESCCVSHK